MNEKEWQGYEQEMVLRFGFELFRRMVRQFPIFACGEMNIVSAAQLTIVTVRLMINEMMWMLKERNEKKAEQMWKELEQVDVEHMDDLELSFVCLDHLKEKDHSCIVKVGKILLFVIHPRELFKNPRIEIFEKIKDQVCELKGIGLDLIRKDLKEE
jgi:hypothetical protein